MSKKKRENIVETIEICDFAKRYGYSEKTVRKNFDKIAGTFKEGTKCVIPDSARYPYKIGHTCVNDVFYFAMIGTNKTVHPKQVEQEMGKLLDWYKNQETEDYYHWRREKIFGINRLG